MCVCVPVCMYVYQSHGYSTNLCGYSVTLTI